MPDPAEQLTLTELLDRLPDNNRQLISPKDVRDIVATFAGQFGRLSILPGTGATTEADSHSPPTGREFGDQEPRPAPSS